MKRINQVLIALLIFSGTSINSFSQGDVCASATNLGNLANPPACGTGNTLSYNGTTTGATAENPYSALTCMDAPAADVWVTFTSSGNAIDLDFTSGLGDANIGIYSGTCGALVGLYCEASNNGNISTTLTSVIPGQTYYMQISGQNETDFSNFNLDLTANDDCTVCLLGANITASPAPTNGFYLPNTTVEVCLVVDAYEQIASNWLSGVTIDNMGSSWNAGSMTGTSSPNGSGNYTWIYGNHPALGDGWFVDIDPNGPGQPDGDFTNNFGDPSINSNTGGTFCFDLTTSSNCSPGGDLSLEFETYSDFETGGYGSAGCTGDPTFSFSAYMLCCDIPLITSIDPTCAGYANGSATATGQGGTAPYDYVWEDSSGSTVYTQNNVADGVASSATGLVADTYTVFVTDDNGCEQIIDIILIDPAGMTISSSSTNSLCASPCSGTLSSSVSGGSGSIDYDWSSPTAGSTSPINNTQNPSNICAGVYTVTATDGSGCSVTATETITVPAPIVPATVVTDESCSGAGDGEIEVTATDGTSGYNISWDGMSSGNPGGTEIGSSGGTYDITNLTVGNYSITITDANGCTTVTPATVNPGVLYLAAINGNGPFCLDLDVSGTDNSFSFDGAGSTPGTSNGGPTYSWDYGDGNSATGTGNSANDTESHTYTTAGTYDVTLTISNGTCSDQSVTQVIVYPMPTVTLAPTDLTCNGLADGELLATGGAGTPAYTYTWGGLTAAAPNSGATDTETGLAPGTYTVTISDGNNCAVSATADIIEDPAVTLVMSGNDADCNGAATGDAVATAGGGIPGYTYLWDNASFSTTSALAGLVTNTYNVTVTDAASCTITDSWFVDEPAAMTLTPSSNPASCGNSDGDAIVSAAGGAGGYSYSWNTTPVQTS
ncbi:MAG: PKD domain-containing protein, partial [Flavobacteriales bacterium]|nr:PKD domain-containing protein [Flavobacteriales bacterium]